MEYKLYSNGTFLELSSEILHIIDIIRSKNVDRFKETLKSTPDIYKTVLYVEGQDMTLFQVLCMEGSHRAVKLIVKDVLSKHSLPKIKRKYTSKSPWKPIALDKALLHASKHNDCDMIQYLLKLKADSNYVDANGLSSLMACAYNGYDNALRLILKNKRCDVNLKSADGFTALHFAVQQNSIKCAECILENKNTNVNMLDACQQVTPLMLALSLKHFEIASLLISHSNTNINTTRIDGYSALHLACISGNRKAVKLLLSRPDVDINLKSANAVTPIWLASYENHPAIVKLLIKNPSVDLDTFDTSQELSPLHVACMKGNLEIVKLLIETERVNVNIENEEKETPLFLAIRNRHIEVVECLCSIPQIDINHKILGGETALFEACWSGFDDIVDVLLKTPNIDVNLSRNDGSTPLYMGAFSNNLKIVKSLLKFDHLNVNSVRKDGSAALYVATLNGHYRIVKALTQDSRIDVNMSKTQHKFKAIKVPISSACRYKHLKILRHLLANPDIDVNYPRNTFKSPLMVACIDGTTEAVDMLMKCPYIDINCSVNGVTPLIVSIRYGYLDIVKMLLADATIDLNKVLKDRTTPLIMACRHNQLECAKLVLEKKPAQLNQANTKGETPIIAALNLKHKKIVSWLLTQGAKVPKKYAKEIKQL